MPYGRGEVWWGPAPQKRTPSYRPWLIVSDRSHPFSHTGCICLGLTTTQHADGLEVTPGEWERGGAEKTSYISPWYVATIKQRDFDRQQGELPERIVTAAVDSLHLYTSG